MSTGNGNWTFNSDLLAISGYRLELEMNSVKARTRFYIINDINYKRRLDLEAEIVETTFGSRFRFRFLKYPLFKKVVSFRVPEI